MDTTLTHSGEVREQTPMLISISFVWNIALALACGALSFYTIFILDDLPRLGDPVRVFLGGVVFIPVVMAVYANVLLPRKVIGGRYLTLVLYFVGMALSLAILLGLWGFYQSFEYITDGIVENSTIVIGFPIAYAIYWAGGRFLAEGSPLQKRIDSVAGVLMAVTLLVLLWQSDIAGVFAHLLGTYADPLTWVVTVLTVIFALLFGNMLMLGDYFGESPEQRVMWQGWLMLSPNIIGFAIFFAGPLLFSFYMAFTDAQLGSNRVDAETQETLSPNFIGFDNFTELLSLEIQSVDADADVFDQNILSSGFTKLAAIEIGDTRYVLGAKEDQFWVAMANTFAFCLILLPLAIIPALALSIILNSKIPGMKFFRAVYFLPSVAAVVGSALIWQWLYGSGGTGYINYTISEVVNFLNSTFNTSIQDPDIRWLNDPDVVLVSVVIIAAWQVVGYNTVLFLAGLQGVPKTLYEAAMIDGANKWQQFRNVTLPMISPTMFFVLITTLITGLQVFNEPFALFPNQTVPEDARTAVYHMYESAFKSSQFGEASAVAWLLFIVIFGITLMQFRLQRSEAY
jgi:ABC-type sugar transport system permease subunit